jgi:hypothetical protein
LEHYTENTEKQSWNTTQKLLKNSLGTLHRKYWKTVLEHYTKTTQKQSWNTTQKLLKNTHVQRRLLQWHFSNDTEIYHLYYQWWKGKKVLGENRVLLALRSWFCNFFLYRPFGRFLHEHLGNVASFGHHCDSQKM